jgi:hypothetical protein
MPKKHRKHPHICKRCKTRFRGRFCPYCGAEYGAPARIGARGGLFASLLRFLFTLVLLAAALLLAIAILDSTAYAHDPDHASVYAVIGSIRNAVPSDILAKYDAARESALRFLNDIWASIS